MDDIEDILDEFDFQKVQTVMKALDWKYFDSTDSVPSIAELRRMARGLLKRAYIENPCQSWFTACGGFEVTRDMYPGDTKKYLTLKFVVTQWENYD